MRALVALVLLLSACRGGDLERADTMTEPAHWCAEERPAHVIVSDALPSECALAICDAVQWWAEQGVTYVTCAVVPDDSLTPDHPNPLFIQVTTNPPEDPGASGDTRVHRYSSDCIDSGEMRFDPHWCKPGENTPAHELGHALGLQHVKDVHNLMFPATTDGWDLTPEQLKQVR